MKIITFQGGLGNQLFQYSYYLWLCKQYPSHKVYGFYPKQGFVDHNGLEIEKWFDVSLPKTSLISNSVAYFIFYLNKLLRRNNKSRVFTNTDWIKKENATLHMGFWQNKKYLLEAGIPRFRSDLALSDDNNKILNQIEKCESVSVHIRRGDYLKASASRIYGNICTIDYYRRAMRIIEEKQEKPTYFFFSDDIEYVKNNFDIPNMVIVDINRGENSFYDIYLMSKCKNMIIANSSFSCWAAYENENKGIIVAPSKWRNDKPSPEIYMDNWIKLKGYEKGN